MKKQIVAAFSVAVFTVSCSKSTKTEQVENPDGTITTIENSAGIVDSSKNNKIKQEVKAKVEETGRSIDNAEDKTKGEFHKAGEELPLK